MVLIEHSTPHHTWGIHVGPTVAPSPGPLFPTPPRQESLETMLIHVRTPKFTRTVSRLTCIADYVNQQAIILARYTQRGQKWLHDR